MTSIGTRTGWPFPTAPGLGVCVEEVQAREAKPDKNPMVSPVPTTAPTEFLTPSTSSEHLRIQAPKAANPLATPTGPIHDHFHIRDAVLKAASPLSEKMVQAVSRGTVDLPVDRQKQIRASLTREKALFSLLGDLKEMQDQIYGQIIGSAEA